MGFGGRNRSLLALLLALLCLGLLLPERANAVSSGSILQYQTTSSAQQSLSDTEMTPLFSPSPSEASPSSTASEVTLPASSLLTQSTSVSTTENGGVVSSSSMPTTIGPQSTSVSTTENGGVVSSSSMPTTIGPQSTIVSTTENGGVVSSSSMPTTIGPQSTSVSTTEDGGVVSSSSIPTTIGPQSTSVSTTEDGGVVSSSSMPTTIGPQSTSVSTTEPLQPSSPSMSSTLSSMSSSASSVLPSPTNTGGTTTPPSDPFAAFFTEEVILIFIIASGAILITILVIILITVIACCWYVSYKRCKRRKVARLKRQNDEYYDRVSSRPVLGALTVTNKTTFTQTGSRDLSQIELANMAMSFNSQGTPRDTRFINGAASGSQSRDGHLTSSFYTSIEGSAASSSLLFPNNLSTIGPTEDFHDIPPVEEPSLTQDSLNNRIIEHTLPERNEYVHADIKAQQARREVAQKGLEEGRAQQLQEEELPMSPTGSQPPPKTTTLSKKQASMVDLSMITMIKNEYFEDPASPRAEAGDTREHMAAGRLEGLLASHEAQSQPTRRKRTNTLDLGALTSLSSPSKSQADKRPSPERANVGRRESLTRQTSQSMANLSYGGEADVESDGDGMKAKSPKKSKRRSGLPRASSMLEELTSIGSPSRHTVDTLMERSQEVDSDSPPEFSSVNRDPPLKSILKNSGSRQNLVTRSNLNLHASSGYEAEAYTPPVPRLPRHILRTSTAPPDEMPQVPRGGSFTQEPRRTRRSSYDVQVGYSHYPMFNGHLDSPPVQERPPDRDGFWGRPLYGYYDDGVITPDMLVSRRDRYMGY